MMKRSLREAMMIGPSCPLRLGLLDSPDYWTDDAPISAVPLERRRIAPLGHRIPTTKEARRTSQALQLKRLRVGIDPSGLTANGSHLQQVDVEEELVISERSQQGRTLTMGCPANDGAGGQSGAG